MEPPTKPKTEMDQAITALGKTGFKGVYAMNDGTAGGVIAAMQAAGVDPKTIPTTGQDAELEAVQRILAGEQYMTVYKATKPEARPPRRSRWPWPRASRFRPVVFRFSRRRPTTARRMSRPSC